MVRIGADGSARVHADRGPSFAVGRLGEVLAREVTPLGIVIPCVEPWRAGS